MTERETLIAYLLMKVQAEDWHAVCDAGMDLRELDAEARGRKAVEITALAVPTGWATSDAVHEAQKQAMKAALR